MIMNIFIGLFATLALTAAALTEDRLDSRALKLAAMRQLPALEHEEVHDKFGQYALRYVTAEGIVVSQRGRLVPNIEGDDYVLITEGEISYIGDDGQVYITKFTAGLDGTHVVGNHLPGSAVQIVPEAEVAERLRANPSEAIPANYPANVPITE